ncbi:MAG TPA: alpha/beta fold hydrolase [Acidimicrobiia bacterium]|nr:alpha/beta fold hydrolase [Acidimicrobiia bacterium]
MTFPSFDVDGDVRIRVHHFTPDADKNAPVVVMCHPTGMCALMYEPFVRHTSGVNFFAMDTRCHGESARGDVTDWAGFEHDTSAVIAAVLERTKHSKVVGLGISSGASAHLLNAATSRDMYRGLFLCEPIAFSADTDLSTRAALISSAERRRSTFESFDDALKRFSAGGPLSHLDSDCLELYCRHGFKPKGEHEEITLCCAPEDEAAIYRSGPVNGVFTILSHVEAPTLVIYGAKSTTFNEESARNLARKIPRAHYKELENAGHFTLFENPRLGADYFMDFMQSL